MLLEQITRKHPSHFDFAEANNIFQELERLYQGVSSTKNENEIKKLKNIWANVDPEMQREVRLRHRSDQEADAGEPYDS